MVNPLWEKAWAEETKDLDFSIARVAGRATKEFPNKEDANWWNTKGPEWVENYILWRKNNPDWKIWTTQARHKTLPTKPRRRLGQPTTKAMHCSS